MNDENEARVLRNQFGQLASYVKSIQKLQSMEGIQARMPFDIELK